MARILLVEPDSVLAETLCIQLALSGHSPLLAHDAQRAIEAMSARPDLMVLEVQLINHNGLELLYELRSYPDLQDIPVIVYSFISESAVRVSPDAARLNIAQYLYKPATSFARLAQAIEQTLTIPA